MNKVPCRKSFTQTLLELAKKDKKIIALASDSRGSVTLNEYADALPEQFVECGIAEQNEVSIAAGMATFGFKPFVCAPASFLSTRSLDQVKVDVAYSNTNVKIIGISGGVSYGALGMSHHSLQDIAVMRAIPGISIILPADEYQTEQMTKSLAEFEGPVYVRMGRGAVDNVYSESFAPFTIGKANVLTKGNDVAIIATGETVNQAYTASKMLKEDGINARVIDMHTIKPFDEQTVIKATTECDIVVTVEEHSLYGGLGEAVAHLMMENNIHKPIKILGFPDVPLITGNSKELFEYYGIDSNGIVKTVTDLRR
ncbi:MAG TPA: transketolase C-terminal domain-containing protein [Clostridia bacterium]|nr:transketolase C-terminal domain-containing protein [Clostridia bacterium]